MVHLQAFGYDTYVLTLTEHQNKLGENSQKCIMLEYSKTITHYYLQNPESKKVITVTHVNFNKNKITASNILELNELPMKEAHNTVMDYKAATQNTSSIIVLSSRGNIGVIPIKNSQS